MNNTNFIDDVRINKYKLDDECIDQPSKFAYWALKHADAVREREEKHREKKVLYAEVEKVVRSTPELFVVGKVTEAAISAAVETDARIVNINREYIQAEYNTSVLSVAVESFRDRRTQIGNLVQLYHDQYWAENDKKIPKEVADHLDIDMSNDINEQLNGGN